MEGHGIIEANGTSLIKAREIIEANGTSLIKAHGIVKANGTFIYDEEFEIGSPCMILIAFSVCLLSKLKL